MRTIITIAALALLASCAQDGSNQKDMASVNEVIADHNRKVVAHFKDLNDATKNISIDVHSMNELFPHDSVLTYQKWEQWCKDNMKDPVKDITLLKR